MIRPNFQAATGQMGARMVNQGKPPAIAGNPKDKTPGFLGPPVPAPGDPPSPFLGPPGGPPQVAPPPQGFTPGRQRFQPGAIPPWSPLAMAGQKPGLQVPPGGAPWIAGGPAMVGAGGPWVSGGPALATGAPPVEGGGLGPIMGGPPPQGGGYPMPDLAQQFGNYFAQMMQQWGRPQQPPQQMPPTMRG